METESVVLLMKLLKFLFYISGFFGVSNFYVEKDSVKSSAVLRAYGLSLLTAMTGYFIYNLSQLSEGYPASGKAESLLFFEYISYWIMTLTCLAASICNQNKFLKWIQRTTSILFHFTGTRLRKLIWGSVVVKTCGLMLIILYTAVFYVEIHDKNYTIVSIVIYIALYGITVVIVIQFANAVLLMKFLFRGINEELSKMLERRSNVNETNLFVVEFKHYVRKKGKNTGETAKLLELSHKYSVYCTLAKELNSCFSLQLLLFSGLCFVELTYSIFSATITDAVNPTANRYSVEFLVIWFLTYVSILFSFTVSCQLLADEAKHSGVLAHRIINNESSRVNKSAIEMFSLQIYQSDLEITAFQLFPVNNSLIYEMVGSVASAIVILIQFRKYTSPQTKGNSTDIYNSSVYPM